MTDPWPGEHVLVAYKSTQWLKVGDVLLVINLEDDVVLLNRSEVPLTSVAPG